VKTYTTAFSYVHDVPEIGGNTARWASIRMKFQYWLHRVPSKETTACPASKTNVARFNQTNF